MPDKRTYQDRREALKKAVVKRRKKIKHLSIEYKGGKCQSCGYNKCEEALKFHHIDPKTKSFGIGAKGYTRSWEKVRAELDKCILLCANCHREAEAGILQLSSESLIAKRGEFGETLFFSERAIPSQAS
jgi:5-methylcytosine-specific restriction endonuclease McrA